MFAVERTANIKNNTSLMLQNTQACGVQHADPTKPEELGFFNFLASQQKVK
jgi:hypothetical protein